MRVSYDLHIHSCLSPCGDNDMTPNNIVNMAQLLSLDVIAVSDHNSALNLPAVIKAAHDTNVVVVPAIEVCTSEEVHMLCLLETLESAIAFGAELYDFLPPFQNDIKAFGEQIIMDENDCRIGSEPKLLINALTISIDRLLKIIANYGGLAIPAHVDKNSNSIISNLGYIPQDYNFPCIEVANPTSEVLFNGNRIFDSDAHYLESMHEAINFLEVEEKTPRGIINALKQT